MCTCVSGLTPANEELRNMRGEEIPEDGEDEEEFYEIVDNEETAPADLELD